MTMTNRIPANPLARTLAEIADGALPERVRLEQAARILVTARRASALAALGAITTPRAGDPAVQAVTEIARHWDETVLTALEYAEALPEAALDRLLRAAPVWAAAFAGAPDRLAA